MQLDKTHVKIRVRTLSEIGDLSLRMIRQYPVAFGPVFMIGAGLWMLIDVAILGWLPWQWSQLDQVDEEATLDLFRYLLWMTTLVALQIPLAGSFATYYLGQAVFEQQTTLRKTIREVNSQIGALIWTLGIVRLAIPMTVIAALRWGQPTVAAMDFTLPLLALLIVAVIRSNRPFLPEMIILEKCPLRSKDPNVIALRRRSKALHSPMAGELGSRFVAVATVLMVLCASIYYTLVWCRGIATNSWSMDMIALAVFFPLSLWLAGSLSVIVRLLGYLDTRIRLEGWEVELAIRAESIRQFGDDAMSVRPSRTVQPQPNTNTDPSPTPGAAV